MKSNNVLAATRSMLTMVAVATAGGQCAYAEEITWGGSSGQWHDADKWVGGRKPSEGDSVVFPGGEYAVEVNKPTPMLSSVTVSQDPSSGKVAFTGDALQSLNVASDGIAFAVGENRRVEISGCRIYLGEKSYMDVGPGAQFDIVSGKLYLDYGCGIIANTNATLNMRDVEYRSDTEYLKLAKGAIVNFTGGSNTIGRIANKISDVSAFDGEGSKVVFSGGYTHFPSGNMFAYCDLSKTAFSLEGGVLELARRIESNSKSLLPGKGAELRDKCTGLAMTDAGGSGEVWELGGKVSFDAQGAYVRLGWNSGNSMQGGGELRVERIAVKNDFNADLGKVVASNFSSAGSGHLYFNDGIAFGANDDVSVTPSESSMFVPRGRVRFDTVDVVDGETPRSFDLASRFDLSGMTALEVEGTGAVGISPEVAMKYLHNFSADAGATVVLTNCNASIRACAFALGADAVLSVGSNVVDVAATVRLEDAATIRYRFDDLKAGEMYPLWFGPHGSVPPVSRFAFDPALPEGWTVATSGSTAYLWDGTTVGVDSPETIGRWTGSSGGIWNDAENWTSDGGDPNIPGGDLSIGVWFSGNRQLAVTNDWLETICCMGNLSAGASAGPYVISGRAMDMLQPRNWRTDSDIASIANDSRFPLTIETAIGKYWTEDGKSRSYFNVFADGRAPVVLVGGGSLTNDVFRFRGDVRLGGIWKMRGLEPLSGGGCDTRLVLLSGAHLETTDQSASYQTVASSYQVASGACMVVGGAEWRWRNAENTHFIDGVVTSTCPVSAMSRQTFTGDGVLSLSSVQAFRTCDLKFSGNITVRPGGWKTVRADADNPMTMIVRDNATIGAWGDWTYGPEAGFESATAAADRALKVVGGAKTRVSFDTEGNTVTLADPLVVEKGATVVKKGDGTLVLESADNVLFDSEVELLGGELKICGKPSFGKLTFDGGAIAVDSELDSDSYVEIFTAKEIDGDVAISGRYRVKKVSGSDGVSVFAKRVRGTTVILW